MATQSLSDAIRSGIMDVLIESCPTKIFLPNEEAGVAGTAENPGPNDFYRALGLNETQVEIIRTATKKRHYYLVSPEGRRLFDLGLGPVTLAFAGALARRHIAHLRLERATAASGRSHGWTKRECPMRLCSNCRRPARRVDSPRRDRCWPRGRAPQIPAGAGAVGVTCVNCSTT